MPNAGTVETLDEVRKQAIHRERISKENAVFQLYTDYSINPFRPGQSVTGKPNSIDDAWDLVKGQGDTKFLEIIAAANLEPTKKHKNPQTSNQEYGWISQPLLKVDKTDQRLYYPQQNSAITKFWEVAWHHQVSMSKPKPRTSAVSATV